jgi:Na+-driven multidrug efflux pump
MNTAGSTMVGQNIAAMQYNRVKKILVRLMQITLTIAVTLSVLVIFFPDALFSLFTTEEAVLAIAPGYVPIAVLLFIGAALRSAMNALINGSGHFRINLVTAIMDGIVMRIGLALLFGLALDMKHYGFWLGDALAGFTPFLVGLVFYLTGMWKKEKHH